MPAHSLHYTEVHEAFRASMRRFVEREIAPHVDAWDEAGTFPRELYTKAAAVGRSTALRLSGRDKITVTTRPFRSTRTAGFAMA